MEPLVANVVGYVLNDEKNNRPKNEKQKAKQKKKAKIIGLLSLKTVTL